MRKVPLFADDTNVLFLNNSIKKLNKLVIGDLKYLDNWLYANKISLNVNETEIVIFKYNQMKFEGDLKMKLCGKRLQNCVVKDYIPLKVLNTCV